MIYYEMNHYTILFDNFHNLYHMAFIFNSKFNEVKCNGNSCYVEINFDMLEKILFKKAFQKEMQFSDRLMEILYFV